MNNNSVEFWEALQELNELTTILSLECPKYSERVTSLKGKLTRCIQEELVLQKELTKFEKKFWTVRNN